MDYKKKEANAPMTDFTLSIQTLLAHPATWILLLGCSTLVFLLRYLIVPLLKRRKILDSIAYCPSLLLPRLPPERDVTTLISSHRMKYFSYRVNLYQLTCSCSRFRQIRSHYPPNDIRRLCRHLRMELEATQCMTQYDELTRGVISFRLRDACYVREPLRNSEMIVGFHPRSSIMRVYTYRKNPEDPPEGPFTGHVDKFTYNNQQEIWIYGEPPHNSEEILTVLARILTACKAKYPRPEKLPQSRAHLVTPIPESEERSKKEEIRQKRNAPHVTTTPLQ